MLKTIETQETETINGSPELLVSTVDALPLLATVDDQQFETERLENIQVLVDEFASETKRRRRKFWLALTLTSGVMLPLFGIIGYLVSRMPTDAVPLLTGSSLLLMLGSFALPVRAMTLTRPSERQHSIINTLIASNDVRAVDPLMSFIGTTHRATRDLLVAALIALLPRLKESDSVGLSDTTQRSLVFIAGWAKSGMMRKQYGELWVDFVVSSLKALANVGDNRALQPVEALATGDATAGDRQRIQQAAVECLEPLRRRLERDRVGQHLLRSSAEPQSEVDMLLIPAIENHVADERELPRPSAEK